MIFAATLVATSHCADAHFCPSQAELRQALVEQRAAYEEVLNQDAPEFTTFSLPRVLRLSDVYCGAPYDGPPRGLTCKFTIHTRRGSEYTVAKLTRDAAGWRIADQLAAHDERGARRR